jgi:adenylosuccinate synthase
MKDKIAVLGLQWGDEGKGKIIDYLAEEVDAVIRFQGGHNAGHTIKVSGKKYVLHLIPSGILHPQVRVFIAQGMVLSLEALETEMEGLLKQGLSVHERLRICRATPLLLPYHHALDHAREKKAGNSAIGTTLRGIGPAYEDKTARRALLLADLQNPQRLRERLEVIAEYHNFMLEHYYQVDPIPVEEVFEQLMAKAEWVLPMMVDLPQEIERMRSHGARILFEGAQGAMLDISYGTYPYVTSSPTSLGGVFTGAGVAPADIDYVLGIAKTYTTRVGAGVFPTELDNEIGQSIAEYGQEFGATTKRPRRCGWFDAVGLRRMINLNGVRGICLTKLDVLDHLAEIKICRAYKHQDEVLTSCAQDHAFLSTCTPMYETMKGWQCSTQGIQNWDDLPAKAKAYIQHLGQILDIPIVMVATGSGRDDILWTPIGKRCGLRSEVELVKE